mmetsp:Transcript_2346/g.8347  ORF Transcript_2346/g.8347 Transcript_2346/m.8347 type:complete len:459 (+) Transcript_2346:91-1467(+)
MLGKLSSQVGGGKLAKKAMKNRPKLIDKAATKIVTEADKRSRRRAKIRAARKRTAELLTPMNMLLRDARTKEGDLVGDEAIIAVNLARGIYKSGREAIQEQFSRVGFEIVFSNLTEDNPAYIASFVIAVSEERKVVSLVYRGSQNTLDWVTNFRAIPTKFSERLQMHKGVKLSMRQHYKRVLREQLENELEHRADGDWRLLVCGHSLGGALSTAASMQWCIDHKQDETNPLYNVPISLFTFGAPLILFLEDEDVKPAEAGKCPLDESCVHNFVNNYDLVPRLLGQGGENVWLKRRKRRIIDNVSKWHPIGNYYFLRGRLDSYDEEANEDLSLLALMKARASALEQEQDTDASDASDDTAARADESADEQTEVMFDWEEMLEELPEEAVLDQIESEEEAAVLAEAGFQRPATPHAYVVSDNISELLDMPLSAGQLKKSLPDHFMPKYQAHICYIFGAKN